jgi:membrane fusion protein (multidrug efflux system)
MLTIGAPQEQIVIPESALMADQEGVYLFVVHEGRAVSRRVKVTNSAGGQAVVADGLSEGEQVIVDRLQAVRPGMPVRATPASRPLNAS